MRTAVACWLVSTGAVFAQSYEPRVGPWLQAPTPAAIVVMWETEKECRGFVELGTLAGALRKVDESHARKVHEVLVDGLAPATQYRYRVGSEEGTSATFTFRSAPARDQKKVRIGAYGDTRTNPDKHALCAAVLLQHEPDLVVHTGDFVLYGPVTDQWRTMFFRPAKELLRRVPIVTVLGNHEANHANYYRYFALPGAAAQSEASEKASEKSNERWWSFRFGPLSLIGLDPNAPGDPKSAQGQWLAQQLAQLPADTWRIAAFHQPMYSAHPTRDVNDNRVWWQAPFQSARMDLVWAGHDHHYQRCWPIGSLADGREPAHAILHTTNGGGGAPLYPVTLQPWTRVTESMHSVAIWDFDGDRAEVRQFRSDGQLFERFTVERGMRVPAEERVAAEVAIWQDAIQTAIRKKDPISVREGAFTTALELDLPADLPRSLKVTPSWSQDPRWSLQKTATLVLEPGKPQKLTLTAGASWPLCYPVPTLRLQLAELDGAIPCRNHTVEIELLRLWPLREIAAKGGSSAGFFTRDGRDQAPLATFVQVDTSPDGQQILVAARIELGDERLFGAGSEKADDPDMLDKDEAFSVVFGVDAVRYLVGANTKGTVYDAKNLDAKWQSGAVAKVRRDGKSWHCELAIPKPALEGKATKIDFAHHDAFGKKVYEWVPTLGKSLDPRRYGTLVER